MKLDLSDLGMKVIWISKSTFTVDTTEAEAALERIDVALKALQVALDLAPPSIRACFSIEIDESKLSRKP